MTLNLILNFYFFKCFIKAKFYERRWRNSFPVFYGIREVRGKGPSWAPVILSGSKSRQFIQATGLQGSPKTPNELLPLCQDEPGQALPNELQQSIWFRGSLTDALQVWKGLS